MDSETFEVLPDGIRWTGDGETLVVQAWGIDSVRIRATRAADVVDTDWALLAPQPTHPTIEVDGARAFLRNGEATVMLTATAGRDDTLGHTVHHCHVSVQNADGTVMIEEAPSGGSLKIEARDFSAIRGGDHALTAAFSAHDGERLYGMGLYQQETFDLKGATLELAHRNSQASVPFVLSSRGYGMLWHNPAIGTATFATNRTVWTADATDQLDYWVTVGATPAAIAERYADATGHAPMMPERGLGYWQCKLRYWNQEQLLEVAREHHRRGLPMDVIVADFFHWPHMGDFRFEEEFWPDPQAMVDELASMGIELMVSVWPQIAHASENYDALGAGNHLVRTERGSQIQMAFEGPSAFADMTSPRARQAIWELCRRNYGQYGIKTFWLDEAEPEFAPYDFDHYRFHAGPALKVANTYPQGYARAFYEGQVAAGETEVVNLLRCAWAGSQRYGALVWSGDISSTWTDLRRQVVAGIQMGIAGIPWFTTDIGGFHAGDIRDPAFHELLIRWFQMGAFSPVMRLHGDRVPHEPVAAADGSRRLGSGAANELWSYGDEVYDVLAPYVHLRETLRPYLREAMREAHEHGQPVMRALFHEFPDDDRCWDERDSYVLGPDLLVAPVVTPGVTERDVYLPAGARWTEIATGDVHEGGTVVSAAAPLAVIPVFARDGRAHGVTLPS